MNESQNTIDIAGKMRKALTKDLFGQDRAIDAIVSSIQSNILKNKNAPKSTYLFLGSPATGKTYLAELMSKTLKAMSKMVANFMVTLRVGLGTVRGR